MAPRSLVSLLFCHLIVLTAGQHLGVRKCSNECNKMTSPIPVVRLISYQQSEESCPKRAIILKTKLHKTFCADPKEKWVQEVMQHLDRQAAALTRDGGVFEKQISMVKPGTIPTTKGPSPPEPTEPRATVESLEVTVSPQEARRPLETSPEVPVAVTEPSETGLPPTSTARAGDAGPAAAPEATEAAKVAAMSTAIVWRSSASYQPEASPWAEEKATEAPSTTVPSTQAPTTSHPAPEEKVGPQGPPAWVQGQSPSPENSVGPEMSTASTDALHTHGAGSVTHPSAAPVPSEGTPGWELLSSGSWSPAATEPVHAVDSQKQSVLITPVPDSQAATRRQAVGLLAFLGLLFCLGVAMFAYQSLQGCPRKMAGEMVEGLRYVPRSCGSNSYVLVPV